jgi:hypothetical protein
MDRYSRSGRWPYKTIAQTTSPAEQILKRFCRLLDQISKTAKANKTSQFYNEARWRLHYFLVDSYWCMNREPRQWVLCLLGAEDCECGGSADRPALRAATVAVFDLAPELEETRKMVRVHAGATASEAGAKLCGSDSVVTIDGTTGGAGVLAGQNPLAWSDL